MYQVIQSKLRSMGMLVVENNCDSNFGSCVVGRFIPTIYVSKGLDDANKTSVLFHELVHASAFWTKRKWWTNYKKDEKFFYMEEVLALLFQKELSLAVGLQDTYASVLSNKYFDRYLLRLSSECLFEVHQERDRVHQWLKTILEGANDDLDRYFNTFSTVPFIGSNTNLLTGANYRNHQYLNSLFTM